MNPLDLLFINGVLANDGPQARPRAAIPLDAFNDLRGNELRFCGYTRPITNAIQYPIALHNPYIVEFLLDRNVRVLDTLLALRTQFLDYQKLASDVSATSNLFSELSRLEEAQETYSSTENGTSARLIISQRETDIANGTTSGTESSQDWANARDAQIRTFSRQRRECLVAHEAELERRRNDVADGSNYSARKKRVEDRYRELLQDAVYRSWAISDGCRICYGKEFDPPQPSDEFLDELVKWHKVVLDEMEKVLRRDTEHTTTFAFRLLLTDGRHVETHAAGQTYIASGWTENRATLSGDTIRFRLPRDVFFPDQDYIRLRGFGFTISGATNTSLGTWRLRVSPPTVSVGDGASMTPLGLAPVFIGGVREALQNEAVLHGSKYYNCDPCSGEWEVRIVNPSTTGKVFSGIINVEMNLAVASLPRIG